MVYIQEITFYSVMSHTFSQADVFSNLFMVFYFLFPSFEVYHDGFIF